MGDVPATSLACPIGSGRDVRQCPVDVDHLGSQRLDHAQDLRPLRGDGGGVGEAPPEVDIGTQVPVFGGAELGQLVDQMLALLTEHALRGGGVERRHRLLGCAWT